MSHELQQIIDEHKQELGSGLYKQLCDANMTKYNTAKDRTDERWFKVTFVSRDISGDFPTMKYGTRIVKTHKNFQTFLGLCNDSWYDYIANKMRYFTHGTMIDQIADNQDDAIANIFPTTIELME